MIKRYLNKIHSIFIATEKYYKQRLRGGVSDERRSKFESSLKEIEQATGYPIEGDLKEFLEWSCLSTVYGLPYQYNDQTDKDLEMLPYVIEENFRQNKYQKSDNHLNLADINIANFIAEYERDRGRTRDIPKAMLEITV